MCFSEHLLPLLLTLPLGWAAGHALSQVNQAGARNCAFAVVLLYYPRLVRSHLWSLFRKSLRFGCFPDKLVAEVTEPTVLNGVFNSHFVFWLTVKFIVYIAFILHF